jgi:hypothetical protein
MVDKLDPNRIDPQTIGGGLTVVTGQDTEAKDQNSSTRRFKTNL